MKGKKLSDICIKECVAEYMCLDVHNCNIRIARDERGKPYIVDCNGKPIDECRISVSHTDDIFMCAVERFNIGIDIQRLKNINYERISKRYFSQNEKLYVSDEGLEAFFKVWVRKEAYAKFTGDGLKSVLGNICVFNVKGVEFSDGLISKEDSKFYFSLCFPESMDSIDTKFVYL